MSGIKQLIRPELLSFKPYSSAHLEAEAGSIYLNANELPWNNSESAIKINRYPEREPKILVTQLSQHYKVQPEQIAFLGGSDEGIDLLVRLFCRAYKDAVMICPPTFGMYRICAQLQSASVIEVPLIAATFQLDLAAIERAWSQEVKIIFACSPNNPTGNLLSIEALQSLCTRYAGKSIIVVDEAYLEFSNSESMAQYLEQYDNLVVLRTLSKAYGLAGARFGVMLAQAEIIAWIKAVMMPYPLPIFTTDAVQQMFTSARQQSVEAQGAKILEERERLAKILPTLPGITKVWPSAANFLLIQCVDADKAMRLCQEQGIILRQINDPLLTNCIRVTIGSEAENNLLIKVLSRKD